MVEADLQRLGVELAVWNAEQLRRFAPFSDTPTGPVLDSQADPFGHVGWTLWKLGAVAITNSEGGRQRDGHGAPPPFFRLAGPDEVRAAIAASGITPRSLSDLVHDFVILRDFVPDAFALTAEPFRPRLPAPLHDALVEAQYMTCFADGCVWTDRMAQRLEWAAPDRHWETDEESRARRLRAYGPIWESMPARLKWDVVRRGKVEDLFLRGALRFYWDGAEWREQPFPSVEDFAKSIQAGIIADNIERLIAEGELTLGRGRTFWRWAREQ